MANGPVPWAFLSYTYTNRNVKICLIIFQIKLKYFEAHTSLISRPNYMTLVSVSLNDLELTRGFKTAFWSLYGLSYWNTKRVTHNITYNITYIIYF